mmetsp:Transcript_16826/g.47932  ORF Transcript_16826/g.47932 Transcript_16826/m.47932 type:complete len:149 (-) Transcript_16826:425-871(-)
MNVLSPWNMAFALPGSSPRMLVMSKSVNLMDVWPIVFPDGPPLAIDIDNEASLLIDVGGAALEETHSFIARWINHLGARTDLRQTSSPFDLHVADSADVQPARNRPAPAVHINLIAVRTVEVHRVAMQEANRPVRPGHRESRTRWSLP